MSDFDRALADAARSGRDAARPAPAAEIRRVGARMRRIRAVTAATLSAAAVAGVIGIVASTTTTDALPDYAETTTPTESPTTPTESPTPTIPPITPPPTTNPAPPILDGRLITGDIAGDDSSWVVDDGTTDALCAPDTAASAAETAHVRYVPDGSETTGIDQWAEAFTSPSGAANRLDDVRAFFGDCAEEMGEAVDLFWGFTLDGVGDAGFVAVIKQPFNADEQLYVVRAAQSGRVVTWLVSTGLGQDFNQRPGVEVLVPAVDLLCGPAGGACAGQPVLTQSYPDYDDLPGPGLPSAEDVDQILVGRWRSGPVLDDPTAEGGHDCAALGTADYLTRFYHDEDGELTQVRVTRADRGTEAAAVALVEEQVIAPSCIGEPSAYDRVPGADLAWRTNFSSSDVTYLGFARAGSMVAFVRWVSFSSADDARFIELLDVAATRLADLG